MTNGTEHETKADLDDHVKPGDTIVVPERYLLMADTLQSIPEQDALASKADSREWHIQDFWSVLYKRRWAAIVTFVVVASATLVYTFTATPVYEAHAQLLLGDRPNIVTFQGSDDRRQTDQQGYLETQYRLLSSRSLLRRVIDDLKLWNNAGLKRADRKESSGLFAFWTQFDNKHATGAAETTETATESLVIDRVSSHLNIVPVRDTRIIEVNMNRPIPSLPPAS